MGAIAELTGDSSVGVRPSRRWLRPSARGLIDALVTQPPGYYYGDYGAPSNYYGSYGAYFGQPVGGGGGKMYRGGGYYGPPAYYRR